MHLSQAPVSLLQMIHRDGGTSELKDLSPNQLSDLFTKLGAVQQLMEARNKTKGIITQGLARTLGVSPQAIHKWVATYKAHGWRGLIDQRKKAARSRASLPQITKVWIREKILQVQRNDGTKEAHRQILDQWRLWQRTRDPQWAIPGFASPPPDAGKGYPAGFSYENIRQCAPDDYQASLARQGRIAAGRLLPHILSTRVGCRYLQYVFCDDQQHDLNLRLLDYDRPMRPLGFNSIERLAGYSFTPHVRLRWFDTDEKTHKHLTRKEFVWYIITLLCTEGFRDDEVGTCFIQEHGTAKVWSNKALVTPDGHHSFQDAIGALLGGRVTFDDSGLFNKADFKELIYGPKSSGNPRFKAPVESFFHAWRTYSSLLIGQSGRNADEAPEENYGIDQYERSMLKIAKELPARMREGLLSNFVTGQEYASLVFLINDALNARTDHALEGWAECQHFDLVWRWAEDAKDLWRSRSELAGLPQHLRDHAAHQQSLDGSLTGTRRWSPGMARDFYLADPCIKRMKFSDAALLVPTEWLKPITVRGKQIVTTDELMPGQELIFHVEVTTERGRTEFLMPGDEIYLLVNPLMSDTALVYDRSHRFIGTICRNLRSAWNDQTRLEDMFRQRARTGGAFDAAVQAAKAPEADRRAHVREVNDAIVAEHQETLRDVTPKPAAKPKRSRTDDADIFAASVTPDTDAPEDDILSH